MNHLVEKHESSGWTGLGFISPPAEPHEDCIVFLRFAEIPQNASWFSLAILGNCVRRDSSNYLETERRELGAQSKAARVSCRNHKFPKTRILSC